MKKFKAVRGSRLRLRLKREERWVGVRSGMIVLKEGSFRHWGRERMVKIWEVRLGWLWGSGFGIEAIEEKGLRK